MASQAVRPRAEASGGTAGFCPAALSSDTGASRQPHADQLLFHLAKVRDGLACFPCGSPESCNRGELSRFPRSPPLERCGQRVDGLRMMRR